jgi:biopolymer transport protein ExbD
MRRVTRRRRGQSALPEVSLTPLIDTVLVLLIVFMVATPVVHQATKVHLPFGVSKDHNDTRDDVVVAIDYQGRISLQKDTYVSREKALQLLQQRMQEKPFTYLVVYADRDATHGTVMELVDAIKQNTGVTRVFFKNDAAYAARSK